MQPFIPHGSDAEWNTFYFFGQINFFKPFSEMIGAVQTILVQSGLTREELETPRKHSQISETPILNFKVSNSDLMHPSSDLGKPGSDLWNPHSGLRDPRSRQLTVLISGTPVTQAYFCEVPYWCL